MNSQIGQPGVETSVLPASAAPCGAEDSGVSDMLIKFAPAQRRARSMLQEVLLMHE
jgi:hypothetical protein